MTANSEAQTTTGETVATPTGKPRPKGRKKAGTAPQKPRVAPGKGRTGKKAIPEKKTPKAAKDAKQAKAPTGVREGSKTATVIALLERKGGATLAELMQATGWQPHSIRGFVSGTLGKKMGRPLESSKREDGERLYQLK